MAFRIRSVLVVILASALSLSACVPAATPETPPAAAPWRVDFAVSGGFAGQMNQMTISADGSLVAENLKRKTRVEGRLSSVRLRELNRLIDEARPASAPDGGTAVSRRCADCLQYQMTVSGIQGRPAISERGTFEGQQPGNRELVGFLTAILNETLRP